LTQKGHFGEFFLANLLA